MSAFISVTGPPKSLLSKLRAPRAASLHARTLLSDISMRSAHRPGAQPGIVGDGEAPSRPNPSCEYRQSLRARALRKIVRK